MCIYCGTSNYRKIYEHHYGPIPVDQQGRSYDIHHIDGNRANNSIDNLVAVSINEHYQIHSNQGDHGACLKLAQRMGLDPETQRSLNQLAQRARVLAGTHHFLSQNRTEKHNLKTSESLKRLVDAGEHNWSKPEHAIRTSQLQCEKVADGSHHLLGGEIQRRLVAEGKHHFLGGRISRDIGKKRSEDGSCSAIMKQNNARRMADGTHQNLIEHTCHHCSKTGIGPGFAYMHFDNCEKVKPDWTVTCPHCNITGSARGPIMSRWHFDNCAVVNPDRNRSHSQETCAKISAGLKGKSKGWQLSERSRNNQKAAAHKALKDKPKIRVQCPHCLKIGGKPAMSRFHMNNCKERNKCE